MYLKIFCDGGARGNPGPAAIGYVIKNSDDEIVHSEGKYIGETTNNQAEYQAVLFALEKAMEVGGTELDFYLDSELVVKQLNREYKVKNQDLAQQFIKIYNLQSRFDKISYTHVYREDNKEADAMVNQALDNLAK